MTAKNVVNGVVDIGADGNIISWLFCVGEVIFLFIVVRVFSVGVSVNIFY